MDLQSTWKRTTNLWKTCNEKKKIFFHLQRERKRELLWQQQVEGGYKSLRVEMDYPWYEKPLVAQKGPYSRLIDKLVSYIFYVRRFAAKYNYSPANIIAMDETFVWSDPNGHIFVDSPSIWRRNSTWKVRRDFIDFERRIHVEIMTSIRCGNFDVNSIFKIDEILMSFPRGFFCVVSTSNRRNCFTRYFHSIIF